MNRDRIDLGDTPHILLINPWIDDFAAYDVWSHPLGLLSLGALLRHHGYRISYIDCLDRFHPCLPATDPASRWGRGPYFKSPQPPPAGLEDIPRRYCRYGIKPEWLRAELAASGHPDLILVTSGMTYWYRGVQATVRMLRQVFPQTAIYLGGVYATLCSRHAARHSGVDGIWTGPGEDHILSLVGKLTGFMAAPRFDTRDPDSLPYPAFDLLRRIPSIALLTSRGCPYDCAYCAARFLNPRRSVRRPDAVVAEIGYWHRRHGVHDFVFYDDALLVDATRLALPMLEGIVRAGYPVRFHTPNALHVREITTEAASLMYRAGFKTLRLGLETADADNRKGLDHKVRAGDFEHAVTCLQAAGFNRSQVGAYLLCGLPQQSLKSLELSIDLVKGHGLTPILAHYSPIPHTDLWPTAVASSRYDLESDPIFTNNAIFPCQKEPFAWNVVSRLKKLAASLPSAG